MQLNFRVILGKRLKYLGYVCIIMLFLIPNVSVNALGSGTIGYELGDKYYKSICYNNSNAYLSNWKSPFNGLTYNNTANGYYQATSLPASTDSDPCAIYATNGGNPTGQGKDVLKSYGAEYAYCVNRRLVYGERSSHSIDSSWTSGSKNAIMAGYIINSIMTEGLKTGEQYGKIGGALNQFFYKVVKDSNAYEYTTFNSYITKAEEYYKNVDFSNKLPAISISGNSNLKYTGSKYISDKITISGFQDSYKGGKASYKVEISASNGADVKLCTNATATANCSKTVSITNTSGMKDYYIGVSSSAIKSTDTITIKVTGSSESTYYSSVLFKSSMSNAQKLLVRDTLYFPRNISTSKNFQIPDLNNHLITVYKVDDDNGNNLTDVELELYKDDASKASNKLVSGKGILRYTSPKVETTNDDFFNHTYWLVEKKAPSGYVLLENAKIDVQNKKTSTCYINNEETDLKYCNRDNYIYMCKGSDGSEKDLNDSGNCEFDTPSPMDVTEPNTDVNPSANETTDTGENESGTEPEEPEKVEYEKVCYDKAAKKFDDEDIHCSGSYTLVNTDGGNVTVHHGNKKNVIKISKRAITGDDELSGATLKICTESSYNTDKDKCSPAKTVDDIEMKWVSGSKPYEFNGIPAGKYYIIEVIPPKGYSRTTIDTAFTIDEKGTVKTGNKTITNASFIKNEDFIVINNDLNSFSISKQDVATSKELPGATLSICRTYVDENNEIQVLDDQYTGECITEMLESGEEATWVSGDTPKVIAGLPSGTYALVEKVAPNGYATAESIIFRLSSDGKLTDKDGNSLADNKLVMHDKAIQEVKTGSLSLYIVVIVLVSMAVLCIGSYCYVNMVNSNDKDIVSSHAKDEVKRTKIRQRKIHKKK